MNNVASLIRRHAIGAFGRHIQVAALFIAVIVAASFAFAFVLMAAQLWLCQWYKWPIEADLTIAGALALLALAIGIVGESVPRSPRPEIPMPISLAVAAPIAAKIAPKLLNGKVLGIASAVLGVVLMRREFGGR